MEASSSSSDDDNEEEEDAVVSEETVEAAPEAEAGDGGGGKGIQPSWRARRLPASVQRESDRHSGAPSGRRSTICG